MPKEEAVLVVPQLRLEDFGGIVHFEGASFSLYGRRILSADFISSIIARESGKLMGTLLAPVKVCGPLVDVLNDGRPPVVLQMGESYLWVPIDAPFPMLPRCWQPSDDNLFFLFRVLVLDRRSARRSDSVSYIRYFPDVAWNLVKVVELLADWGVYAVIERISFRWHRPFSNNLPFWKPPGIKAAYSRYWELYLHPTYYAGVFKGSMRDGDVRSWVCGAGVGREGMMLLVSRSINLLKGESLLSRERIRILEAARAFFMT